MTYRLTAQQMAQLDPSWQNFDFSQVGSSPDSTLNAWAKNLSPDQIASLSKSGAGGYGFQGYADGAGGSGQDINPSKAGLSGYAMFSPQMNSKQGGWQNYYGPDGTSLGQHYNQPQSKALSTFDTATEALLAYLVGGAAMGGAGMGSAPGIGGTSAGSLGDATAAGYDPAYGAMNAPNTAAMGAGAAPNTAAMGASGGGLGSGDVLSKAALDGTTSFGANSVPGALDAGAGAYGTSVIPSVTVNGAAGTAGALTGGGAGGGISDFLSSLGLSPSLAGTAATLLGGLAGSKGVQTHATQTRDIPEWLKPYVTGQGGVLNAAQQMFQQNQGNQAGWQGIQSAGQNLMQQPVAGNGYQQFMARPRFGG